MQSRNEILAINPAFAKFVLDLQLSDKPEPFQAGEHVFLELDDDEAIPLTEELARKLNKQQNEEFETNRDINPFPNSEELVILDHRLIISSKDNASEYLSDIANSLEHVRVELKESNVIVLGVHNTPWRHQENSYLPVSNALNYLKKSVDATFDGGFLLKEEGLLEFIPHLFWLTRCNASLPCFYRSFPKAKTIITLCKYGVLHFEFFDQDEKMSILQVLSDLKFREVDSCGDPVAFDNFNERRIKT